MHVHSPSLVYNLIFFKVTVINPLETGRINLRAFLILETTGGWELGAECQFYSLPFFFFESRGKSRVLFCLFTGILDLEAGNFSFFIFRKSCPKVYPEPTFIGNDWNLVSFI